MQRLSSTPTFHKPPIPPAPSTIVVLSVFRAIEEQFMQRGAALLEDWRRQTQSLERSLSRGKLAKIFIQGIALMTMA